MSLEMAMAHSMAIWFVLLMGHQMAHWWTRPSDLRSDQRTAHQTVLRLEPRMAGPIATMLEHRREYCSDELAMHFETMMAYLTVIGSEIQLGQQPRMAGPMAKLMEHRKEHH